MLFGATIANMVSLSLNAFLAAYLIRRFGYTLVEAGLVAGLVASLPATLSIVIAGWLADRFARRGNRRSYRSEEHTSELQSLMRISFAVFCLTKKQNKTKHNNRN